MWTTENRPRYDRKGLRYPSDLTDAEWDLVKPLIPPRQAWRPQAGDRGPRRAERHSVCSQHRVPVARAAEGPAAAQYPCTAIFNAGTMMEPC